MTSYERVLATINHEKPDRPPCDIIALDQVVDDLTSYLNKNDAEELYQDLGIDFRRFWPKINKTQTIPESVRDRYGNSGTLACDSYGLVRHHIHPNFPQYRVYGPFYHTKDLDSLDWPEPDDITISDETVRRIARMNAAGICTGVGYNNPLKIGYFLRRFEDFMADCLLDPDFITALLKRIARVEVQVAEIGVRAGVRFAFMYGDFADQRSLMLSPKTFRKLLKPVLADAAARLKAINPDILLFLHSDGNLWEVLPDLIECGFAAIHPIQLECMDMLEVKRVYGDRLTLFGGISVQSELPFLKPDEVRALVRRRIEELGSDGGFMLAPTNSIMPDVPRENTVAMYREAAGVVS